MSNHFTITGNIGAGPRFAFTPAGKPVFNVLVLDTPRRKNEQTGEWEDAGETLAVEVAAWGDMAEHLGELYPEGTRGKITATGRLQYETYEHKGETRTKLKMPFADSVSIVPREPQGGHGGRLAPPQGGQAGGWGGAPQGGQGWGGGQAAPQGGQAPQGGATGWGNNSAPFPDEIPF